MGTWRSPPANIAFTPTGSPLQVDGTLSVEIKGQGLTESTLISFLQAAQGQWSSLVDVPGGSVWNQAGISGIAATSPEMQQVLPIHIDGTETEGNARFSQGGLYDYLLSSHFHSFNQTTMSVGAGVQLNIQTDQASVNSESPFATNSHAIQSQLNPGIVSAEKISSSDIILDAGDVLKSFVSVDRTLIDQGPIEIANGQIGGEPSSPSRNGAGADFDIIDLQQLPLLSLESLPETLVQRISVEGRKVGPIFGTTTKLSQSENQQNQNTLQHSLSFGSQTLPPDRNLVNNSGAISYQPSALSLEQLALLNQATINIADLADGYLALTLGTTITIDTDAAGYGWFIDPTPLLSEEFVPYATSHTLSALDSEPSAISHQLLADPDGPAYGRMDLLTVLMHELGHVMGLGHVSSAVDGTRLMAGSIDPGIRRVPSSLDKSILMPDPI